MDLIDGIYKTGDQRFTAKIDKSTMEVLNYKRHKFGYFKSFKSGNRPQFFNINSQKMYRRCNWERKKIMFLPIPYVFMRDAVFMVSPKRQYLNITVPTIPAMQEPKM